MRQATPYQMRLVMNWKSDTTDPATPTVTSQTTNDTTPIITGYL